MTRKETLAKVEARIAFHAMWLVKALATNDHSMAGVERGNMSSVAADLKFLKRGTNWRLAHSHYPYTAYMR